MCGGEGLHVNLKWVSPIFVSNYWFYIIIIIIICLDLIDTLFLIIES